MAVTRSCSELLWPSARAHLHGATCLILWFLMSASPCFQTGNDQKNYTLPNQTNGQSDKIQPLSVTFTAQTHKHTHEATHGGFRADPCSHRWPRREWCGYTYPSFQCPVHCGCTAPPDTPTHGLQDKKLHINEHFMQHKPRRLLKACICKWSSFGFRSDAQSRLSPAFA